MREQSHEVQKELGLARRPVLLPPAHVQRDVRLQFCMIVSFSIIGHLGCKLGVIVLHRSLEMRRLPHVLSNVLS